MKEEKGETERGFVHFLAQFALLTLCDKNLNLSL